MSVYLQKEVVGGSFLQVEASQAQKPDFIVRQEELLLYIKYVSLFSWQFVVVNHVHLAEIEFQVPFTLVAAVWVIFILNECGSIT